VARNIVLASGILDFSSIRGEYFRGVAGHLRNEFPGLHVFSPPSPPLGSLEHRAERLAEQVAAAFAAGTLDPARPVHILAHSMGGLDARFLVAKNLRDLRARIASLTTIATPHLGSPVASVLDRGNALEVLPPLFGLHGRILDDLKDNLNAVHDLSEPAARAFNKDCPDDPGVRYFEVAGIGRKGAFHTSAFFLPTFLFVIAKAGRNDGVVPFESATRGREPVAQWPGDHADLIGLNLDGGGPVFDHLAAYADLVRRLSD
jgi:triacylglycerol lipase